MHRNMTWDGKVLFICEVDSPAEASHVNLDFGLRARRLFLHDRLLLGSGRLLLRRLLPGSSLIDLLSG